MKEGLARPPSLSSTPPLLLPICSPSPSCLCSDLCFPLVFPQDCRLPRTLLRFWNCAGCASICCSAAVSLSNTSPQPNRMIGNCGLIVLLWCLWVGCCGSVSVGCCRLAAFCRSLCVSDCGTVAVRR